MHCRKRIILLLLIPISLIAQIKIHKSITASDGIINSTVLEIFEDSKGFIWFATEAGISRWDGTNFLNFNETNGLVSSYIFDITEDHEGRIYFANFGTKGINTFKDGKLDTLFYEGDQKLGFLTIVYAMQDRSLLMCANDGIILYKDNVLLRLNNMYNIVSASMHDICENSKGEVFIATEDGIVKVKDAKLSVVYGYDGTKNNYVQTIGVNNKDEIYFTNEKKLLKIVDGEIIEVNPKLNYLGNQINHLLFREDNTCYMATKLGLGILDAENNFEMITLENGLANNNLFRIFISKNGYVYTASAISDVNIFMPNKVEIYNSDTGLNDNLILNLFIDSKGKKYLNTSEGLEIIGNNYYKFISGRTPGYNSYVSLIEMSNDRIFIGTSEGIDLFNNGNISPFVKFDQSRHLKFTSTNNVFSLTKYDDTTFLAGTYRGVMKITPNEKGTLKRKDGLISDYVKHIYVMKDKSIIYGYHNQGISIFNNNSFRHISDKNGLSNNAVTSIYERSDGAILIGTQLGGLNIITGNTIDTLTVQDGLSSNEIRAINEDDFGNVYVSTGNGLNIITFNNDKFFCRVLTTEDGLANNDCSLSSLIVDDSNYVWIGTSNGLTKYSPQDDIELRSPPSVYFTGIDIFNKEYPLEVFYSNPKLDYDQNYVNFSYAGINIPNNNKTVYKHRLKGVDIDWVIGKTTSAQYTSLDDGDYVFEVQARNEWGYWSEPASLSFVINPAWWETWWFYTLSFILIGSLIAFVASYRYRQLLEVEKIRTKISADLHDSIGSGLSEITILSELLNSQPNADIEDLQNGLKNITVTARSLVGNMSDIVWLVNPSKDSLKDLLLRLQDSYQEIFARSNVSFKLDGIDNLGNIHLPLTYRQHLFLLFKEAINNSLKYSACSNIELKIAMKAKNLSIEYNDNGKGFNLDRINKSGNGLTNMRNRAKAIGGDLKITSEINKGTNINFLGNIKK